MVRRQRNSRRRLFKSSIKLEIRRRDLRAKKCTKSVIQVHSCCCANLYLSLFFFYVPVAVAVVVAKALFYLKWCKCSKNTHWDWLNRV